MNERERLPDHREAELVDFEHAGRRWTATIRRFAGGRIAEVFIDGPREAPIVELAQETAIAASLALQSGCALETLSHALAGRSADRSALRSRWSTGARHEHDEDPTTQSKEPIMPKKSKPERKASELEKPYEMTPPETDGEEHIVACCAEKRSRGRKPGFRMSEEHRTKIQNSRILRVLIDHVEGREEISPARVTAALGLLKKVLPDVQAVTIGGDPDNPLRHEHAFDLSSMSDEDLAELARGGA